MQRVLASETIKLVGQKVTVQGWVHSLRNMGKLVFIDLRDHSGLLQLVCQADDLPKLGSEYVIEASGEIRQRDQQFHNPKLATGEVELGVERLSVLNPAKDLPFEPHQDTRTISEDVRLKYRYLDLRSERLQNNLRLRHRLIKAVRNFLDERGFTEVETPVLTKGTPEGAREFIVPARQQPGEFYVLPQSPQQFKQLLMVAGLEKYYQMARIFRDEDPRADRQPEAAQIDIELSFVEQEDVLRLVEQLIIAAVKEVAPESKPTTPFPRLTWQEAMDQHGSEKPDLRQNKQSGELAFCWVIDFPLFEAGKGKALEAMHHPFTAVQPADVKLLDQEPTKAKAAAYDLVLNGVELGSGSIRIHQRALQQQIFELLGLSSAKIEQRFGHLLEAFEYGAPPHGGIAIGIDRLAMVLAGEQNIREVIAFPKTGDGRDLMMGAPSPLEASRLKDAHIQSITKATD